jgi:predicted metal-dependent HD superfamily phosphohydrolase
MTSVDLAHRWARVAVLLGGEEDAALATGLRLAEQYEHPRRSYHTAEHACRVADAADNLAQGLQLAPRERQTLMAAALAHDVIYQGRPGEDEEASAQAAERALLSGQVNAESAREVARLIRTTAAHRVEVGDKTGAALSDSDLSILGSEPSEYDRYALDVRREYSHVSDEAWRVGRTAVLTDLLQRPTLFVTEPARRLWERQAHRNMTREIRSLQAPA